MVDVFSATITWTWDQGDQGSEVEFLISSGTFFQSWLALYAMQSKPNVFVLGFWASNIWKFLRLGVFFEFKEVTHDIRR